MATPAACPAEGGDRGTVALLLSCEQDGHAQGASGTAWLTAGWLEYSGLELERVLPSDTLPS